MAGKTGLKPENPETNIPKAKWQVKLASVRLPGKRPHTHSYSRLKTSRGRHKDSFYILLIGFIFFVPYLGGVHLFDWDEINFAECAREMLLSGKYLQVQIGFRPFWEKPPFFFWMQALSMKAFGINEFAARLPNALIGMATLLLIHRIGRQLKDRLFARLWVASWLGSLLPHFYFRSGIIDPWFNFWIFAALWMYFRSQQMPAAARSEAIFGGILLGLAVLTKGPVAGLIAALTLGVYVFYWKGRRPCLSISRTAVFAVAALFSSASWFLMDMAINGTWLTTEFIKYQYRLFSTPDAGHAGFPAYHLVVLLIGCFPASIFALRAFWQQPKGKGDTACRTNFHTEEISDAEKAFLTADFRRWMLALFWVVLILFSIVKSKIVHYSSLAYFPVTFLATLTLYDYYRKKVVLPLWQAAGLFIIALLLSGAALALPFIGQNTEWLLSTFPPRDPFAAEAMQADVSWNAYDYLPGLLLLFSTLFGIALARKKRWRPAVLLLFGGMALFVQTALYRFIGKIETYSQRAAIEFCESKAEEDAYVVPLYYKSYAHWFYAKATPDWAEQAHDLRLLLKGKPDRKVFFMAKINQLPAIQKEQLQLKLLYRKNGFVFFERRE